MLSNLLKILLFTLVALAAGMAAGQDRFILVQSTTSTQNSGLYEWLLPRFTEASGIEVRVVAVGTGQAIKNASNCDGDVLLVHARQAEEAFVAAGYGTARWDVMFNDFIIVGPGDDPAGLLAAETAAEALRTLAQSKARFASRGDDSGTHKREQALWRATGIDPVEASGDWYLETGSGMGATLNTAVGLGAYALTDRATWVAFKNKAGHAIAFEGGEALVNQYGVIPVSPDHCPNAKAADAGIFVEWLLSPEGQGAIGAYRVDGQQLFFPNAG